MQKTQGQTLKLEMPCADPDDGHAVRHISLKLTPDDAQTLRSITAGLQASGATIDKRGNEHVVNLPHEAIQWMLRNAKAKAPSGKQPAAADRP